MSNLNNIWDKYRKIGTIGYGVITKVYKGKMNDEYYAIKEINKMNSGGKNFLKEMEVMKKMECDNMVKIIESIETQESFYVVSELCHLNIEQYLNKRKKAFSVEEIKELLLDLNKGLKVMYEKKVIHGDIKPSNILLSFNNNNVDKVCFKISDFGLSNLYKENIISKSIKGTSQYISPECLKDEKKNHKSDISS